LDCNTALIGPQVVTGLILGFLYALIALGYTMVYGVLKLINFAHDVIFATGGIAVFYAFGLWFGVTEPLTGVELALVVTAALLIGGIASSGAAAALERLAYRPLRRRNAARLSYLITAIGASFFMTYMYQQDFLLGTGKRSFPNFMDRQSAVTEDFLGTRVTDIMFLVVLTSIICLIILDRFINQTRTGRSIRALSEDITASQLMGVNVDRVIVTTFVVGGFFAGVAGVLYGMRFGNVVFNMGFIPGLKAFTAAVLGGIGNIRGAMLGGLTLGLVEHLSSVCIGSEWKNVVSFSVLVLVLVFKPTGILGERMGG
jgi:branched-chain amino acid transport system permease protein